MPDGGSQSRCAAILTAIEVEYEAVCAHLTNLRRDSHGRVHYYRGTFSTINRVWDVVVRQTGPGNVRAAVETLLAIHYFHPALVLFVGVAGGLKDVALGDVIIPTKVYTYESGRANVTSYQTRPDVVKPTFSLVQLAQAEAREKTWLQRLTGAVPAVQPHVLAAPIASGESVVASTRSAIYRFLRANFSDAVAVEMESFGFLLAAYYHPDVEALVIRGISDCINSKKRTDRDNFQVLAAGHASAFAFEILAKVDVTDLQQSRYRTEMHNEPVITTDQANVGPLEPIFETPNKSAIPIERAAVTSHKPIAAPLHEPEIASKTNVYSQEFLKQLQRYKDEIREMHDIFGEGRVTFYDQCKRAMQLIENLEAFIKEYYKNITYSNRIVKFKLDKLNEQIRHLLSELSDFLHIYFPAEQGHHYATSQRNIRRDFKLLLEKLEQLEELEQTEHQS